jgi:hypothetical protein
MTITQILRRMRAVAAASVVVVVCGCAGGLQQAASPAVCAGLDSLYEHSGFESPLTITGKATIDANQYRIRGIIRAEMKPSGDIFFEFNSSIFFGSQIEDFFFSLVGDTMRIVDRERGQYYEGASAAQFLREALAMDFDAPRALRLALGGRPACDELRDVRMRGESSGAVKFDGRVGGDGFDVVFGAHDRRLERVRWPLPEDRERGDRLRAEYRWSSGGLGEVTMQMEKREWRCKISATD